MPVENQRSIFKLARLLLLGSALAAAPFAMAEEESGDSEESAEDLYGRNLSPKQKQAYAAETVVELKDGTQKVLKHIDNAQRDTEPLRLNCLNTKLSDVRGLLKVAEDASFGLDEAIVRENVDLQEHNFRKVKLSREQGRVVVAEADGCVAGTGTGGGDGTIVTVSITGAASGDDDFGKTASSTARVRSFSEGVN